MRASFSMVAAALLMGALVVGCGTDGGSDDQGAGGTGGTGGTGGFGGTGGTGGTGNPGGSCTASSTPGTVHWSCNLESMCMDFIGSTFAGNGAVAASTCENSLKGVYSDSPCDRSKFAGGCLNECGRDDETMNFFPPDSILYEVAEESCLQGGGTWIE